MRGKEEAGEGIGVIRDMLTQFWQEVYNALTTGATERSPIISAVKVTHFLELVTGKVTLKKM